jgi:hypothetical protein
MRVHDLTHTVCPVQYPFLMHIAIARIIGLSNDALSDDREGLSMLGTMYWAVAFALFYGLGIPLLFWCFLRWHRDKIRLDQESRREGRGFWAGSNPQFYLRWRFSHLYADFRPECW